ncbi:hypothetical protein MVEG_11385 [Podila verticillata NRRL 6337]|uniref:Uncharacterized protein n=1 Tax=Podila verticillata NRRL 6337 TaxID=1069443 RepID=A0A086TLN3_9FUNG|nr:hypothetical protein MVEG_11385 [Podila verticillata NRRL 6337]
MLNLIKLVELLHPYLDRQRLVQCALVNKLYYAAVMPLLFKHIPELKTPRQKDSFRRLVLQDYSWKEEHRLKKQRRKQREKRQKQRQKKQYQQIQQHPSQPELTISRCPDPESTVVPAQPDKPDQQPRSQTTVEESGGQQSAQPSHSLLEQYGKCIRTIPSLDNLLFCLQDPPLNPGELSKTPKWPSKFELLERFLSRCPCLKLSRWTLSDSNCLLPELLPLVIKYIIPATTHLILMGERHTPYNDDDSTWVERPTDPAMSTFTLELFLKNSSRNLELLSIDMAASWVTEKCDLGGDDDKMELIRSHFMTGIEHLQVLNAGRNRDAMACWSWIWKHAGSLKSLFIDESCKQFLLGLTGSVASHLGQLQNIHLGRKSMNITRDEVHFSDNDIGLLLSVGQGYKHIYLDMSARAGRLTAQYLPRHYTTLTEFTMEIGTSDDSFLVDILAFSPNLRKLMTIQDGWYPINDNSHFPKLKAEVFADLDPTSTRIYRPWECEATLEILLVKIVEIPLGDAEDGFCVHRLVYRRLARLTKLQSLWLGHEPTYVDKTGGCSSIVVGDVQADCLKMTLQSGLELLRTLKRMRHLCVEYLHHDMRAEEYMWILRNWLEFEHVWGIDYGNLTFWMGDFRV